MRRTFAGLIAIAAFVALPGTAAGQDLAHGTWTGTVTPPEGTEVAVTYEVTHPDGKLTVLMKTPMGDFPFLGIGFDEGALLFGWKPGDTTLQCRLVPSDDGGYLGDCLDKEDRSGTVRMVPPGKAGE